MHTFHTSCFQICSKKLGTCISGRIGKTGYRVKRTVQKIEPRDADEEMAQLLGIEIGGPILCKERTVYAEGTPVEFTYCYNRGDTYSLTTVLSR
jgi:DNA-binding GntR family transcriptional regulator